MIVKETSHPAARHIQCHIGKIWAFSTHLDKAAHEKKFETFWAVSEVPRARWQCCGWDVRDVEAQNSFALGSSVHWPGRSFDRMMIAHEWQISNLGQSDDTHASSKFIVPRLICHVMLMLFMG